jgi:phytoene dehydrogenase-like protein
VNFRFTTAVSEILIVKGKAIGIKVGDESFLADTVISNMDMVNTYRKLLPGQYSPHKLLNQPKSSSALIFYWGIKAEFKELGLHNIFFSANYEAEFKAIFKDKTLFDDPTVYINITSKLKPDDAASASENWFVMINVPHNDNQDWDALIAAARMAILSKLSKALGRNIVDLIEQEDFLDPRRIESRTSSFGGALYGNSSNTKYAAFLRHPNKAPSIKNLFFCGGSVHPGGGIPLSLLSAKQMVDYYVA